jgi:hypothetical protein
MDSYFIQQVTLNANKSKSSAEPAVLLTNRTSQQLYPGTLAQFYTAQSSSARPLRLDPLDTLDGSERAKAEMEAQWMSASRPFLTEDRKNTLDTFYAHQMENGPAPYRTPNQRIWNVPTDQLMMRIGELG